MSQLKYFEFLLLTCGTSYVAFQFNVFPPDFFLSWQPISFFQLLEGPLPEYVLVALRYVWFFSLVFAGIGVFKKVLCPLGAVAGVIALGHHYNFGNVYHGTHLYIGAVVLTCFFPKKTLSPKLFLSMMKFFVVFVMCLTGIQKLYYGGGLDWAFSDAFYMRIASNPFHPFLAKKVLEGPLWFSQFLGGYSLIVVELLSPLALLNRRFGRLYFFIWSTFHLGVTLIFTNHFMFYSQIFVYSVFLDIENYAPLEALFQKINGLFSRAGSKEDGVSTTI